MISVDLRPIDRSSDARPGIFQSVNDIQADQRFVLDNQKAPAGEIGSRSKILGRPLPLERWRAQGLGLESRDVVWLVEADVQSLTHGLGGV